MLSVNVLVEKEEGQFVAHCLEMDIATSSPDADQIENQTMELVLEGVRFAFENGNLENLFRPAPSEFWTKFAKAVLIGRPEWTRNKSILRTIPFGQKQFVFSFHHAY